jgi:hypothetical protein
LKKGSLPERAFAPSGKRKARVGKQSGQFLRSGRRCASFINSAKSSAIRCVFHVFFRELMETLRSAEARGSIAEIKFLGRPGAFPCVFCGQQKAAGAFALAAFCGILYGAGEET